MVFFIICGVVLVTMYAWEGLFTAQTLWKPEGHDPRWQRIIKAIIRDHAINLEQGHLACDENEPELIISGRAQ